MSNYNSLKTTIDANIKQNGRQEITGQILNSVLNQMVTTLGAGYQFAGVATTATNPGSPDAKVFYIANGKGTYTNFGGLEVTEDEVVVLYWDSSWHKVSTGIASQAKLSELESKATYLSKTSLSDYLDTYGYVKIEDGALVVTTSYTWKYKVIPVNGLLSLTTFAGKESASTLFPAVIYLKGDSITNENFIAGAEQYGHISVNSSIAKFNESLNIPKEATHCIVQLSLPADENKESTISLVDLAEISEIKSSVGILTNALSSKKSLKEYLTSYGFVKIENNELVINSSSYNWKYGIIPINKLLSLVTFAGAEGASILIPAIIYLNDNNISGYIVGSEQYGNIATASNSIKKFSGPLNIPKEATHCIVQLSLLDGVDANGEASIEIIDVGSDTKKDYYVLSKDGDGDFSTIEDVLNNVPKNCTVFVKNGEYSQLKANGARVTFTKGINWIGENREKVIFSHYEAEYSSTSLVYSGTFKNITFLSGDNGTITEPPEKLAYALHIDFMLKEEDVVFGCFFYNCKFISYWNTCVGIGQRKDYVVEMHDCDFEYLGGVERESYTDIYVRGCIAAHNVADMSAVQYLGEGYTKLYNCRLHSTGNCCMMIHNHVGIDYPNNWELIGNVMVSDGRGTDCVYSSNKKGYIQEFDTYGTKLSKMSYLNNISFLNNL